MNENTSQFWWNRGPAGPKGDKGDKGDPGAGKLIYSNDEVEIGTWIDGSPVYRKVLTYSGSVSSSPITLDCASLNIKDIISRQITFKKSDGNIYFIPYVHTTSLGYAIASYYSKASKAININGAIVDSSASIIVILEYTKN